MLIETKQSEIVAFAREELAFLAKQKRKLGEQKIDVLVDYPTRRYPPRHFYHRQADRH